MSVSSSPPRAPPIKYTAPLGTRWAKEKAAAGGVEAFDLPTDPKNIGPWILGECVGKGASGRVKIAKHRHTGQLAAVKILPIAPLVNSRASLATQQAKSDKQRLGIDREITMMKLMNHPNIMRIYDVFEGDKELFLVLEYVEGGELFDFLVNRGRLPPGEALAYFKQIVYGLNYAHTFSIIHRDLKPENILIASMSPPIIKIADWGMAAFAPPSLQLETSCGSPHYASPEIVNGEKYQGTATDIWSCGVILYALLTGRLPFDDKNVRILLGKVKSGKYDMPAWIDPLAKDLLQRMLVVDVRRRITIPEILAHPWLHTSPIPASANTTTDMNLSLLPPSPSTLARPISSPSLIDLELLSSLRVIWGRHTDPQGESIKRDLCSPIGQGVHAKAFYFLLGRYREESLRNNSDGCRDHSTNRGEITTKSNLGWELDRSTINKRYDGNWSGMLSVDPLVQSCTPSPTSQPTPTFVSLSMRREATTTGGYSSSRGRASPPAGPRAHSSSHFGGKRPQMWRTQSHIPGEKCAPPGFTPHNTSSPRTNYPRPPYSRQGYSYPVNVIDISSVRFPQASHTNDILNQHHAISLAIPPPLSKGIEKKIDLFPEQDAPYICLDTATTTAAPISFSPTTTTLDIPAPISTSKPVTEVGVANILPLAIKATYVEDKVDENVRREHECTVQIPAVPLETTAPRSPSVSHNNRAFSRTLDRDNDKENCNIGEGWNHININENGSNSVGLGMGRNVGRDMSNITHLVDETVDRGKKGKDKKTRPTTITLRALNQKRSTLSVLGSPVSLSSPANAPTNPSRLLTSPVVGEFKGWFTNLFNWKNQANGHEGILYSLDDVSKTRAEIGRLLEGFGVLVEGGGFNRGMSPGDCGGTLKCRVEELGGNSWTTLNLKPLRFRVAFSSLIDYDPHSPLPNQDSVYLVAPQTNTPLLTPNSGVSPRTRASTLINKGGPLFPSPALGADSMPPGCASAVTLIYEKGSVSSFRIIWRKLKGVYADGSTSFPSCSPAITSTPAVEHPMQFLA